MVKKIFSMMAAFVLTFSMFAGSSLAASVSNGKDSKGTYTVVTYTASDLKAKVAKTKKSITYYQSNTYAFHQLLAGAVIGVYSGGASLFFGATDIAGQNALIKKFQGDAANYKKLLTIANASQHGVKVKRYYQEHYATGLGMVKGYYGSQIVTSY